MRLYIVISILLESDIGLSQTIINLPLCVMNSVSFIVTLMCERLSFDCNCESSL